MLTLRGREESPYAFTKGSFFVGKSSPIELRPVQPGSAALTEANPAWMDATLQQLEKISALERDWDSYGAPVIALSRISQAYNVVQSVMHDCAPPPELVPTSDGSIQIEWHAHGMDLEILLVSDADLDISFEDLRGELPSYEGVLNFDVAQLVHYLRVLAERTQGSSDG